MTYERIKYVKVSQTIAYILDQVGGTLVHISFCE